MKPSSKPRALLASAALICALSLAAGPAAAQVSDLKNQLKSQPKPPAATTMPVAKPDAPTAPSVAAPNAPAPTAPAVTAPKLPGGADQLKGLGGANAADIASKLEGLQTENGVLSGRIGELVDQVGGLEKENGLLSGRVSELGKELEAQSGALQSLSAELQSAKDALAAANDAKAAAEKRLGEFSANADGADQLRETLAEMEAKLASASLERDAQADAAKEAEEALAAAKAEAATAKAAADAAMAEIQSLKKNAAAVAAEAETNEKDLADQRTVAIIAAVIAFALAIFAFFRRRA